MRSYSRGVRAVALVLLLAAGSLQLAACSDTIIEPQVRAVPTVTQPAAPTQPTVNAIPVNVLAKKLGAKDIRCVTLQTVEYCFLKAEDGTLLGATRGGAQIMLPVQAQGEGGDRVQATSTQLPPIELVGVTGSTFWATYGAAIELILSYGWAALIVVAFYGPELLDILRSAYESWIGGEPGGGTINCGTQNMYYTCWA